MARLHAGPRLLAGLLAAPTLLLAIAASCACLSSAYVSAARDLVRHSAGRVDVLKAAHLATTLSNWRDDAHLVVAESLTALGRVDDAIAEVERAISLDPANGYTWAYLARLRGARNRPDPRLTGLYQMALRRSPHAEPLEWAIAMDGVERWRIGDDELRRLWRLNMAKSLRHDRRRFLATILRNGRDPYWCQAQEGALPVAKWCALTRYMRDACGAPDLTPKASARCREAGLAPPVP